MTPVISFNAFKVAAVTRVPGMRILERGVLPEFLLFVVVMFAGDAREEEEEEEEEEGEGGREGGAGGCTAVLLLLLCIADDGLALDGTDPGVRIGDAIPATPTLPLVVGDDSDDDNDDDDVVVVVVLGGSRVPRGSRSGDALPTEVVAVWWEEEEAPG